MKAKSNPLVKLALLACLLLPGTIFAQYAVGLKGGANFCNYGGRYLSSNYQSKVRPNFGFVAEFETNSWFTVQAELTYDAKGASYSRVKTSQSGITEEYNNFEENLNYLTLPVLARFDLGDKKRVFGYTGLYAGYLLSATIKGDLVRYPDNNPSDRVETRVDRDYKSDIDNFDLGAVFGVGFDIAISENYILFADGRFNWGWGNVAQAGQGTIFNNAWSVNIGFLYRLPEKTSQNTK